MTPLRVDPAEIVADGEGAVRPGRRKVEVEAGLTRLIDVVGRRGAWRSDELKLVEVAADQP